MVFISGSGETDSEEEMQNGDDGTNANNQSQQNGESGTNANDQSRQKKPGVKDFIKLMNGIDGGGGGGEKLHLGNLNGNGTVATVAGNVLTSMNPNPVCAVSGTIGTCFTNICTTIDNCARYDAMSKFAIAQIEEAAKVQVEKCKTVQALHRGECDKVVEECRSKASMTIATERTKRKEIERDIEIMRTKVTKHGIDAQKEVALDRNQKAKECEENVAKIKAEAEMKCNERSNRSQEFVAKQEREGKESEHNTRKFEVECQLEIAKLQMQMEQIRNKARPPNNNNNANQQQSELGHDEQQQFEAVLIVRMLKISALSPSVSASSGTLQHFLQHKRIHQKASLVHCVQQICQSKGIDPMRVELRQSIAVLIPLEHNTDRFVDNLSNRMELCGWDFGRFLGDSSLYSQDLTETYDTTEMVRDRCYIVEMQIKG